MWKTSASAEGNALPLEVNAPPLEVNVLPLEVNVPPLEVSAPPLDVNVPPLEVNGPPLEVNGLRDAPTARSIALQPWTATLTDQPATLEARRDSVYDAPSTVNETRPAVLTRSPTVFGFPLTVS